MFTPAETLACRRLVDLALEEDLDTAGDLTSKAVIPADLPGRAVLAARTPGVLSGLPAAAQVVAAVDPGLLFQPHLPDGSDLEKGDSLATLEGPLRSILAVERTALNFVQRLSGVATLTRQYVTAIAGLSCYILDTRKTTPGWRLLEKYAVRCGGGRNHRLGLYDGILVKDNHLAGLGVGGPEGTVWNALRAALAVRGSSPAVPLEIEVDNLAQLEEAFRCQPDMILLDNMSLHDLRAAVRRRNAVAPGVLLEASGGVQLATVRAIAETGVDRISVGALTHSAPALDIALDYLS
jgi:nicotinate-nucleotide pyrophosphorylase (carboxylating)